MSRTRVVSSGQDRVMAAAVELGIEIDVRAFPAGTKTADDAAAAIGCDVSQIVKSLVFVVDQEPVVVLIGGADRLDEGRLAAVAEGVTVRRATPDEVRHHTGFPVGGVPPIGHATQLRCFLDDALLSQPVVWAAAGTPTHVLAASPDSLAEAAGARIATMRQSRDHQRAVGHRQRS